MSFWVITNIDMWLSAGVLFLLFWILYKAGVDDIEKHEKRIRRLESDVEDVYKRLRTLGKFKPRGAK